MTIGLSNADLKADAGCHQLIGYQVRGGFTLNNFGYR